MFERISNGMELIRQSLRVLGQEKSLVVFPILSGMAGLAVLASFALPLWGSDYARTITDDGQLPQDPLAYALLFAFYFANYFVIVFFNSALISCAMIRFQGGDPTVADGLRAAASRLPQIVGWALLSATVGVVLKAIESRSQKVGWWLKRWGQSRPSVGRSPSFAKRGANRWSPISASAWSCSWRVCW
jgi:hypothetical protein